MSRTDSQKYRNKEPVTRVRNALTQAGSSAKIINLLETGRTAKDAALSIGCEIGAIVKTLVFVTPEITTLALIAGDNQCNCLALSKIFGVTSNFVPAGAKIVKEVTGFTIGAVAPIGHVTTLPVVIDESLYRHEKVYAAAGHPHCIFEITPAELIDITNGVVRSDIT